MIPRDIQAEADAMGAEGLEEITLSSGEVVYLLRFSGKVGLPAYLHYEDGIIVASTYEQSMALFDEPAYMGDDE
jgi:hypothetical protein